MKNIQNKMLHNFKHYVNKYDNNINIQVNLMMDFQYHQNIFHKTLKQLKVVIVLEFF